MISIFSGPRFHPRHAWVLDIAERTAARIWPRLRTRTSAMGTAELRGYVRARAPSVIRAEVQRRTVVRQLPPSQQGELIAAALERTVHLLIRRLQTPPVVAIPAPHVRVRRVA